MFKILKLIFKIIALILTVIIIIVALAVWKGGEPFRWVGEGVETAGQTIKRFGNSIDDIKRGGEAVGNQLKGMKETLDKLQDMNKEQKEAKER